MRMTVPGELCDAGLHLRVVRLQLADVDLAVDGDEVGHVQVHWRLGVDVRVAEPVIEHAVHRKRLLGAVVDSVQTVRACDVIRIHVSAGNFNIITRKS